MKIILAEETRNNWSAEEIGVATLEKKYGCDILSTPPTGGDPHPVEVKGWGLPFRGPSGKFNDPQDLRASQMEAAERDGNFRVEIVANLTAHLATGAPYERLTLTAQELRGAVPRLWELELTGKEAEIRVRDLPAALE